jgi:hypothetical protein
MGVVVEEEQRPMRAEREEHAGIVGNVHDAHRRDRREPDGHDRAEQGRDLLGAAALHREQRQQDGDRDGNDVAFERRRHELDALDGRQHRNRRRDHGIAVK